jgi:hypothetical protein
LADVLAITVTLLSLMVGLRALVINGVSHRTSFSSIMCSTRSETLDSLTLGPFLAAEPLAKEVLNVRLKFGLLRASKEDPGLIRRAVFGMTDEVDNLVTGVNSYKK